MTRFLWICFAGALGTGTRYLVTVWAGKTFGTTFPYGTLIVNVVGCFLIAAIARLAVLSTAISPTLRATLTIGFLGGLTTYSSFNYDTTTLLGNRAYALAALNAGVTLVVCFAAGLLGAFVAQKIVGQG